MCQLLEAIRPLQRGAAASPEDQQRVEDIVKALERQNPNKASLAAPQINGVRPRNHTKGRCPACAPVQAPRG